MPFKKTRPSSSLTANPSDAKKNAYFIRKNRERKKDASAHAHRKNQRGRAANPSGGIASSLTPADAPPTQGLPAPEAPFLNPPPNRTQPPHPFQKFIKNQPKPSSDDQ